jgi:hypothetical protein
MGSVRGSSVVDQCVARLEHNTCSVKIHGWLKADVSVDRLYLLAGDGKGHTKPAMMRGWSVPVWIFGGCTRTLEVLNLDTTEFKRFYELYHVQCQSGADPATLDWLKILPGHWLTEPHTRSVSERSLEPSWWRCLVGLMFPLTDLLLKMIMVPCLSLLKPYAPLS